MKIIDITTLKTVFESEESLTDFLKHLESLASEHFSVSKDFRALIHFNAVEFERYKILTSRIVLKSTPFNLVLTQREINCGFGQFLVIEI